MSEPMNPYAGVICCGGCGKVDIDEREYMRQMSRPDSFWVCPQCGSIADFDDARFEELNPEIGDMLDSDVLGYPAWALMKGDEFVNVSRAHDGETPDSALPTFLRGAIRSVKEAKRQGYHVVPARVVIDTAAPQPAAASAPGE